MLLRANAVCKINIYLDVLGQRADGYNDIATVFLPLETPADALTIDTGAPGELSVACGHAGVPEGPDNLCWKAAMAFARATGVQPAWRLSLDKRIPVAAGLGGGSSDAAAVLIALNRLHGAALTPARLAELAATIGADVAFFLDPRPALGRGIGNLLTAVPCAGRIEVVLANPGFPVSAAWTYANRNRTAVPAAPCLADMLAALAAGEVAAVADLSYNALEYAVQDKFPLVGLLREVLLAHGCLCAHVSGSGPTVYGLCPAGAGPAVAARVSDQFAPAVWTCAAVVCAGDSPLAAGSR